MENEILYKSVKTEDKVFISLDYYIITENISAQYCDLKCYGIKIEKTVIYEGGGKSVESRQINNVFYRSTDAEAFLERITEKHIEPCGLRNEVETYIVESIDKARKTA
jgi:hypothetical protein